MKNQNRNFVKLRASYKHFVVRGGKNLATIILLRMDPVWAGLGMLSEAWVCSMGGLARV